MKKKRAALLVLLAFSLTGCASRPDPGGSSGSGTASSPDPQAAYKRLLGYAKAEGASEEQLRVLEGAGPSGVGFPEYEKAAQRAVACLRDIGSDVAADTVTTKKGYPSIDFGYTPVGSADSGGLGLDAADTCVRRHFEYIAASYEASAPVKKAEQKYNERFVPAAIECLKDSGVEVPVGASWDDLEKLSQELMVRESEKREPAMPCTVAAMSK